MVVLKVLLPSQNDIKGLTQLSRHINIFRYPEMLGGDIKLLITDGNKFIELSIEYSDVVFKFECFSISISDVANFNATLCCIDSFNGKLRCLFRYEWECLRSLENMPLGWEPFIRMRGRQEEIPSDALHRSLTMVGVGIWSDDAPVAAITVSDNDPATFEIVKLQDELSKFISECHVIDAENASKWICDHLL